MKSSGGANICTYLYNAIVCGEQRRTNPRNRNILFFFLNIYSFLTNLFMKFFFPLFLQNSTCNKKVSWKGKDERVCVLSFVLKSALIESCSKILL